MNTWRTLTALVVAGVLLGSRPAGAQDGVGIVSELERTASTSPEEKARYGADAVAEIGDALKTITRLLEAAKKDSDQEAIQCLTSRQAAVRALLSVSETANASMASANQSGEVAKAEHEFRRLVVALTKTRMLLAESQRCTGDQAVASGDTIIDTNVDGLLEPFGDDPGTLDDFDFADPPQVTVYF